MAGGRLLAQAGRGVALRIEIDQQGAHSRLGKSDCQVNGRRGFAHPAFLISNRDDFHPGEWFRSVVCEAGSLFVLLLASPLVAREEDRGEGFKAERCDLALNEPSPSPSPFERERPSTPVNTFHLLGCAK